MGSRKAAPTTGTSRRSAITRCFCSTITATAWRRSCDRATSTARTTGTSCSCRRSNASRPRASAWRSAPTPPLRKPEIYEALETRGVQYAIRIPANKNLEWEIADLLFRPPGRPSRKPLVRYKSFHYQAGSWTTAAAGRGESRAPRRRAVPARRLHRDESRAPQSRRRAVLQQARHGRAMDQGRQAGGALDATVVSSVPGERSPAAVERARLQPRESVAAARAADSGSTTGR